MTLILRGSTRFLTDVQSLRLGEGSDYAGMFVRLGDAHEPAHYHLVPFTDVATIGISSVFYGDIGPKSEATDVLFFAIKGIVDYPTWRQEEPANISRWITREEIARMQIDDFLEEVYRLAKINQLEAAADRVFDFIDRILCDGLAPVCDEILRKVDIDKLPTPLMRSFLSITVAAKQDLPSRPTLYRKIEKRMIELKGAERTRNIIGSLA